MWIDRDLFAENFCQDVSKTEGLVMAATQRPLSAAAFDGKITDAGWKNLPSWYQVSLEDRMIPPPAEQFMAQRISSPRRKGDSFLPGIFYSGWRYSFVFCPVNLD